MRIAIASGKGGTGKTLVAVNLAAIAGRSVTLVDCDVEEPNDHIFLKGDVATSETVSMRVPAIDESRCTGCRACVEFCSYNALISFGGTPLFFPDLCHGCDGCRLVCRARAISETALPLGEVRRIDAAQCTLLEGRLAVGGAISGYCETGRAWNEIRPMITVRIDRTEAKIGRLTKKWAKRMGSLALCYLAGAGVGAGTSAPATGGNWVGCGVTLMPGRMRARPLTMTFSDPSSPVRIRR